MTIRRALPEEAEEIVGLVAETVRTVYPKYYPRGIVDFFVYHHRMEEVLPDIEAGIVYVSEHEGRIVGTVTVRANRMDRLFVIPEFQGMGFGKELIVFSEDLVFSEYEEMIVESATSSIMMHDAHGFRTVGYGKREHEGCTLVYPVMIKLNPGLTRF